MSNTNLSMIQTRHATQEMIKIRKEKKTTKNDCNIACSQENGIAKSTMLMTTPI